MRALTGLSLSIGIAIAGFVGGASTPYRPEISVRLGHDTQNMAPIVGMFKLALGCGAIAGCLGAIRYSDQLEREQAQEADRLDLQAQGVYQRNLQAIEARLDSEKTMLRIQAEDNVRAQYQEHLSRTAQLPASVPAVAEPVQQPVVRVTDQAPDYVPANIRIPTAQKAVIQEAPESYEPQALKVHGDKNIAQRFGAHPKSAMLIGVPGSGKGMFLSNAIRELKQTHPNIQVIGIDPKADPRELGYWSEGFDHAFRKETARMDDPTFLTWVKGCTRYFRELPDEKLLVFDEITATFKRWQRLDSGSFESFMSDYCTSICSSGDSRQNYVWLVGQVPHCSALGIDGGIRSSYKPVAIVSKFDRQSTDAFLRASFVAKPQGGAQAVYEIMEQSPVGRAVYDYMKGAWVPMPELVNHSGYDRDSRSFL